MSIHFFKPSAAQSGSKEWLLFTPASGVSCSTVDILDTYWHAITKMHRSYSHSESPTSLLLPSPPSQGENSSCSYLQIALDGNKVHMMSWKIPWGAAELLKCQFHKPYRGMNCGQSHELAHQGLWGPCSHRDTPSSEEVGTNCTKWRVFVEGSRETRRCGF